MAKSQVKKNTLLISILAVLIILTVVAYYYNPYERQTTSFNRELFTIENVSQQVTRIELKGEDFKNELKREGNLWTVNDQYLMDPSMRQVFFQMLEQISVQRPVTNDEKEQIRENVLDSGVQVNIYNHGEILQSYTVGGVFEKMRSYFVKGEDVYLVQIPGYQSYVAGIFEVPENDWRDRVIFDGIWQDMVSLKIKRPDQEPAEFKYEDGLLRMQSKEADTVAVMNFVERFNYFFVDQFLKNNHIALEKKDTFDKAGSIHIQALDSDKSLTLEFYKNPDFNAYLVNINKEEWAAIRNERMEKLWIELEKLK